MAFDIVGVGNDIKVPGFYGESSFAAGTLSASGGEFPVLLMGMRTSSGNLTVDSEVRRIQSEAEAITAAGRGSQLHRMYLRAIEANPTATIYMMAITENAGGTAATVTGVITGTPGEGTVYFYMSGVTIPVVSTASDTIDTFGAKVAAAFTAKPDLPVSCAYNSGTDTVTWTHRHKGTQGKDQVILMDASGLNGLAIALTGSSALSGDNIVGVRMGAAGTGASAEDVTTALTANALAVRRYPRIASAQNDTTNAPLIEAFVNTQAGPTKGLLEQVVFGANGSQGTTTTLSQTNLNAPRCMVVAARNYEVHPSELAAYVASLRAATENLDSPIGSKLGPVPDYDGKVLGNMPPQRITSDRWSFTEKNALLNAGATPLDTVGNNIAIVRAICSYCSDGSAQDERCLDIGDATCPDYIRVDLELTWKAFRDANPGIQDDPADGEDVLAGIAYPRLWRDTVNARMGFYARKRGWIEDRFSDAALAKSKTIGDPNYYKPVQVDLNIVSERMQSAVPTVVTRVQHQMLAKIQQIRDLA